MHPRRPDHIQSLVTAQIADRRERKPLPNLKPVADDDLVPNTIPDLADDDTCGRSLTELADLAATGRRCRLGTPLGRAIIAMRPKPAPTQET